MYGLTRATTTLIGAAIVGFLLWAASETLEEGGVFEADASSRFWGGMGLLAAAGLVMALSQLLGGWTKWGWPRVSGAVFLAGFLPVLIAGLWVLFYIHPGDNWLANNVRDWSRDLGIDGVVESLSLMYAAIAFLIGLVFGFTFDTSGPRVKTVEPVGTAPSAHARPVERRTDGDETVVQDSPRT